MRAGECVKAAEQLDQMTEQSSRPPQPPHPNSASRDPEHTRNGLELEFR